MKVLGIDPGSIKTGYGVVQKLSGGGLACLGAWNTNLSPSKPLSERLFAVYDALSGAIIELKPDCVVVETMFFAKNARSAVVLAHVRGVALMAAAKAGLKVYEYDPKTIKLAVTGYGAAEKEQVQKMVKLLLKSDSIYQPDAADALAAAICHINHSRHAVLSEEAALKNANRKMKIQV